MNLHETIQSIHALKTQVQEALDAGKKPTISMESLDTVEKMARNLSGDYSIGKTTIQEAITSTDAVKLIPKVIEGKLREAAEPEYLGTRFFQTVRVDGGNSAVYVIPVVGEVIAYEVGEAGRYNESNPEFTTLENSTLEIRVKV